jgi:hypothetical protein
MFRVGPYIALNHDKEWFKDQGVLGGYVVSAQSKLEIEKRLQWLSEGSLEYHMTHFQSKYYGPDGNPQEKELYSDFIRFLLA